MTDEQLAARVAATGSALCVGLDPRGPFPEDVVRRYEESTAFAAVAWHPRYDPKLNARLGRVAPREERHDGVAALSGVDLVVLVTGAVAQLAVVDQLEVLHDGVAPRVVHERLGHLAAAESMVSHAIDTHLLEQADIVDGDDGLVCKSFDELDLRLAGVGGKAAIEVGRRLKALSKVAQVIVVTHLPQVAAWGDTHFVVLKDESGSVTLSQVRKVSSDERIEEIARMLAGHEDSISARKHAEELLAESR